MRSVVIEDNETILTVPAVGGIVRVDMPDSAGTGREIYHCSSRTAGSLLAGLETTVDDGRGWIDLLGASNPGVAILPGRTHTTLILAFDARTKSVRHRRHHGGDVIFHLPPTVWVLKYVNGGALAHSNLLVTATRITSVVDRVTAGVFPFGNAHDPVGMVCWGNVTTQSLIVQDPMAVDNLFFATGFNDDVVHLGRFAVNGQPFAAVADWIAWQAAHPTVAPTMAPGGAPFAAQLTQIMGERD